MHIYIYIHTYIEAANDLAGRRARTDADSYFCVETQIRSGLQAVHCQFQRRNNNPFPYLHVEIRIRNTWPSIRPAAQIKQMSGVGMTRAEGARITEPLPRYK